MTIGVYIWLNKINYKKYVGQSINVEKRKKRYLNGGAGNSHLKSAFKKYGFDNFTFTIFPCDIKDLNKLEVEFIRDMKLTDRSYGYNIQKGGSWENPLYTEETRKKISEAAKSRTSPMLGRKHTEETRKKISEAAKGRQNWFKGRKHTEETRKKISEAAKGRTSPNKGRKASEETRKRISEATKGRISPTKGKILSEETRKKISEANKGKKASEETRKKMRETRLINIEKKKKIVLEQHRESN